MKIFDFSYTINIFNFYIDINTISMLLIILYIISYFFYSAKKWNYSFLKSTSIKMYNVDKRVKFLVKLPKLILNLIMILLLIALLNPRLELGYNNKTNKYKGIDIIFALDISPSMRALDFTPNRLEIAKKVMFDFVNTRKNDRIGLVVFSGESYPKISLTYDYEVLRSIISNINFENIEDGTAIGMGIASALNRLKKSDAKSKIVILLTDGSNTVGAIDPIDAAKLAKELNVKVYSIGIGTANAKFPIYDEALGGEVIVDLPNSIDYELLKEIARISDAKFYKATNETQLIQIYNDIEKLEKTELITKTYNKDLHKLNIYLISSVLILLILYFVLRYLILTLI